mmetsp:Transcript_69995/g.221775  ORF Transcript_69995/g.221775 Transcript_69995/m.221775 type:complete len:1002 (+) Transcript_69995:1304-4309(+)|eukprot:CAMPEP_0182913958 /NCGR_PEP_ID=MMETSP0034_2-20130328/38302_1 /TAXON_ID=156128 /ORGANISM="Nephroselmis pyriformis, Strain CCMP717" /LENGTH=1001 /DNA_ID=CAMNT_0025050687 /DNA_START=94 /DNA_END=3099 /DNA_ORIENTATION=-
MADPAPEGEPPKKKSLLRHLKPTRVLLDWAAFSIRRPFVAAFIACGVCILLCGAAVGSGKFRFSQPTDKDWDVNDKTTRRGDAVDEAQALLGDLNKGSTAVRQVKADKASWYFLFHSVDGGNVFTAENIAKLREVENFVRFNNNISSCCQLRYELGTNRSLGCVRPTSPLNWFYPSYLADGTPVYDGEGTAMADIPSTLALLSQDLYNNGFFFVDGFGPDNLVSEYTRSMWAMGAPLPGFSSDTDDEDAQLDLHFKWCQKKMEADLQEYFGMKSPFLSTIYRDGSTKGGIESLWLSNVIMDHEFETTAMGDFMWAAFSILFVWSYMTWHTGSLLLACVGMFEIVMSFPVAFFFYRLVFGVEYFANVHNLIIFVILGIGADDVFVFIDAYKQSAADRVVGASIDLRLYYTVKRASKAIFLTSATTCIAFLSTAISDIMPISSFGIWAALVISSLFIINCFVIPPFLVIWATYFEKTGCCCCCPCLGGRCAARDPAADEEAPQGVSGYEGAIAAKTREPRDSDPGESVHEELGDLDLRVLRRSERFFNGPWTNFINKTKVPLIAAFLAILVVGAVFALGLEPPKEEEKWFPSDHMFQKYMNVVNSNVFIASRDDDVVEISVMWGITDMDVSGKNKWNPLDRGRIDWDEAFDPSTKEAQRFLDGVCERARDESCGDPACVGGDLVRAREGLCFTEGLKPYLAQRGLPPLGELEPEAFLQSLWEFSLLSSTDTIFTSQLGFIPEQGAPATQRPPLRFLQFKFNSTFSPSSNLKPGGVIRAWDSFANKLNSDRIRGVDACFSSGGRPWAWEQVKKKLVSNAVQGMSICFVMALVVLNVSTGNFIIASFAIVTILGIVASVLGIGVALVVGWDFGISESISSVILIGFSVDYCVHLAGAYVESKRVTRFDRMQDSLTHMGISVTAGAGTTMLSGAILWACTLTFFTKFAFLIVSTIFCSYVWSVMFFTACLFLAGPENGRGDWAPIVNKLLVAVGLKKEKGWGAATK